MIRINLAARKKPVAVQTGAAGGGAGGDGTTTLVAKLRQLGVSKSSLSAENAAAALDSKALLRNLVVVAGIGAVLNYTFTTYTEEELGKVSSELATLQEQKSKLDADVAKRSVYEKERGRIEAEEQLVQAKIATLDLLSTGRDAPPRILELIAQRLPAEVWLSDFQVTRDGATLSGYSESNERVTDFMSQLDGSPYFREPSPRIENQVEQGTGAALTRFELSMKRRGANGG